MTFPLTKTKTKTKPYLKKKKNPPLALFLPTFNTYAINLFCMCLLMMSNIYQGMAGTGCV